MKICLRASDGAIAELLARVGLTAKCFICGATPGYYRTFHATGAELVDIAQHCHDNGSYWFRALCETTSLPGIEHIAIWFCREHETHARLVK